MASLHAVAAPRQGDGMSVVEETGEDARGQGAVVTEDPRPSFEGLVGGNHDRSSFVSLADDLEQEIGSGFVYR